jgi:streptogramin lyase
MNSVKIFIIVIGIAFLFSCRKKDKNECPFCPVVESISPTVGRTNDTITITGIQFGTANNIVKFNGTQATVITESPTRIRALVPLNCGSGPVTVDQDAELTSSNSVDFTFLPQYTVTTLAGDTVSGSTDGTGTTARFSTPMGIAIDNLGSIFVADGSNHCIRRITTTGVVTTFAGQKGTAGFSNSSNPLSALFNFPYGVAINSSREMFVADVANNAIRRILPSGTVSTFCGAATSGHTDGFGTAASFAFPMGVTIFQDTILFIADFSNNEIRKCSANGFVKTLSGSTISGNRNGKFLASSYKFPISVAIDNKTMFVVDYGNFKIRTASLLDSTVNNFAGNGLTGAFNSTADASTFSGPTGIAVRNVGGRREVYIADQMNNVIRLIDSQNRVATVLGDGTPGFKDGEGVKTKFRRPFGLAFDPTDNSILYITDEGNHCIRKVVIR